MEKHLLGIGHSGTDIVYINSDDDICEKLLFLFGANMPDDSLKEVEFKEKELFISIIKLIKNNADILTVVVENKHIDAAYTDTYYHHFSGLHFCPDKYCRRLSFYQTQIEPEYFFEPDKKELLYTSFVGTMVIRPLRRGFIGRTLLNPYKLSIMGNGEKVYLRTADFQQHILGVEFKFPAFPFCSQDACFMTCAEVTIMNMMEYFGMKYHVYRSVLPSDIKGLSKKYQYERVTPSAGLTYNVVSKILSELGFDPRLYNIEEMKSHPFVGDERENEIKRIMHYYVESGIPVAVNVEPRSGKRKDGHSLLCIGHSGQKDEERARNYSVVVSHFKHEIVNSADFYTRYCVIDDHLSPYEIRDYCNLSSFYNMRISNLAVPLYKKMYLEAAVAYDIFYGIIQSEELGIESWNIPKEYLGEEEAVVLRIFQASTRSFKTFKVNSYGKGHKARKAILAELRLPQFIWCCELFSYSQYVKDGIGAFAELILDASSFVKNDSVGSLISIETVDRFISRDSNQPYNDLTIHFLEKEPTLIPIYTRNLS